MTIQQKDMPVRSSQNTLLLFLSIVGTSFVPLVAYDREKTSEKLRLELAQEGDFERLEQQYLLVLKEAIRERFESIDGINDLASFACLMNEPEVLQALFDHEYDIVSIDKTGLAPITWAILHKKDEAFSKIFSLLRQKLEQDAYQKLAYSVLSFSIQSDNSALCNPLTALQALEVLTPEGWSAISWAVYEGMLGVLGTVLRDNRLRDQSWGTDPIGNSPLMLAVKQDSQSIAETLLAAGADPLEKGPGGESPFSEAIGRNNKKMVVLFATQAARNDMRRVGKSTALHWASGKGEVRVVEILLEQGLDACEQDAEGNTALHVACYEDQSSVIPALISFGSNISTANNQGLSSLDISSKLGHSTCLSVLAAASTEQKNHHPFGWTPFIMLARRGNEAAMRTMLSAGVAVDQEDNDDNTALYWASRYGHLLCVELLLQAGAEVNHINTYGWNALYWAVKNHHAPVVRALLDAGALPQQLEDHTLFLAYTRATLSVKKLLQQMVGIKNER